MNINDKVKVVLTNYGLEAYRDHYRQLYQQSIRITRLKSQEEVYDNYYKDDCTRTERLLETELWALMDIFGKCLNMGSEIPFKDNEIEILTPKEDKTNE